MKTSVNPYILLCLFVCLTSLSSCDNGCKENYIFYNEYYLHFYMIDEQTGQNLLEVAANRYNRDTVEIYNEKFEPLGIHPDLDGSLQIPFLELPRDPDEQLNHAIERTYYIYFVEGDYDTLNINYQIGLDQCDEKVLTQWSTTYNDSLYFEIVSNPRFVKTAHFIK